MKKKVIILMLINTICSINMSSVSAWTAQPTLTIDPTNQNILYNDETPKRIFPVMLYSFLNDDEYKEVIDPTIWNNWGFNMIHSYGSDFDPVNGQKKFLSNCNKFNKLCMLPYNDYTLKSGIFHFPDEPHSTTIYGEYNKLKFDELKKKWLNKPLAFVNFDLQPYFLRKKEDIENDPFDSKIVTAHGSTTSYSEFAETANVLSFDYYPFTRDGALKTIVPITSRPYVYNTSVGEFTNLLKTKYPDKAIWPIIQTIWYDNPETIPFKIGLNRFIYIYDDIIRHITFDAIINGADGVSFWGHGRTGRDPYREKFKEYDPSFATSIWKATLYQTKELQELQGTTYDSILLEDNVKNSHVKSGKVNYSFKKVKNSNKYYLFITNAKDADTTVNVTIPFGLRIKEGRVPKSIGKYFMPAISGISDTITKDYRNIDAIGDVLDNGRVFKTTLKKYGTNIISMELAKNKKNDIAVFYNYLGNTFKVQLITPSSTGMSNSPTVWADMINVWSTSPILKTIPGDFNNDGYDDIATFYNYASDPIPNAPPQSPKVHLITSDAQGGSSTMGAWADYHNKWSSTAIQYALPGDFNNDGNDDIAVFYTAPATTTFPYPSPVVKLICSDGSGGRASTVEAWADLQGQWNSNDILFTVPGDFNNDGRSDIAVFYRYACSEGTGFRFSFRVHLITTDENGKSKIIMNWCDQYNISDSDPILRVVSGDFNNDGNDDIAFFYNYACSSVANFANSFKVHLITSNGKGGSNLILNWADFKDNTDSAPLLQTVAGDFNNDGHDDIAWFYNYPSKSSSSIHLLTCDKDNKSITIKDWATLTYNQWNPLSVFSVVAGDFSKTSRLKSKESSENSINPENSTNAKNGIFRNYPNPFKENTSITYELKEPSFVQLKIYNNSGHEIKVLVNEFKSSGVYNTNFNASSLSNGIYYCNIKTNEYIKTTKMIILK